MNPGWLSVVGIGEDGLAGLSQQAKTALDQAQVLVGGERHLAMLASDSRPRLAWPTPLADLFPAIKQRGEQGQRVCVLATGDPLCYGVGAKLIAAFGRAAVTVIPAPSAFSLACARLGWSLPDVDTLTVHGRPLALLVPYIQPNNRLLALSWDGTTPAQAAGLLCQRGYGASTLTVLEHLGGDREASYCVRASKLAPTRRFADLNTLVIECRADSFDTPLLTRAAGLPDDAFEHDGQLSKREVRAVTLARLLPATGQRLWDVGAGAGSVAIEWLRLANRGEAFAVERSPQRAALCAANSRALGVPQLTIVQGSAPQALADLPPPDAVFIGGGVSNQGIIDASWAALRPGGRLVANTVTVEGEAVLMHYQRQLGGELIRIAVSRAAPIGGYLGWQPLRPVTQWAMIKTNEEQSD